MSLNSAYSLVKKKRPIISPNPTFMRILEQFEYELYHNYAKQPPLQQQTAQCQPPPAQQQQQQQQSSQQVVVQQQQTNQQPPPQPHVYRNPKIYSTSKQISGNTSPNKLNINNTSNNKRAKSTSNINRATDYLASNIKQKSYKFIETGNKRSKFSMDDLYDNVNPNVLSPKVVKRQLMSQPVSVKQKLKSNPLNPYILTDVN